MQGTATVLQYLCPVGILAYTCVKDRVAPTLSEVVSMLLAIGGTFLIATHGQLNHLAINPKGLAWGLISAFAYALYIILPIQLIQNGGVCWWLVSVCSFRACDDSLHGKKTFHGQYSMDNLMGLVGLVMIGTIFAYTAFLKGTSLVGAVKGSLLASFEPISAVFFAFVIMKEHFYGWCNWNVHDPPCGSLDFPQGFHDSKEKASCKIKGNHILVKRLRRRS